MKKIIFSAPHIKRYATEEFSQSEAPKFVAISVTGTSCELMCNHCEGRLLQSLYHVKSPSGLIEMSQRLYKKGCDGVLITGGCDKSGILRIKDNNPLSPFNKGDWEIAIKQVKERFKFKVALHTKLADENFAKIAKDSGVDMVMIDIVGSEKTLRDVYNLKEKSLSDIMFTLEILNQYNVKIAPHIVVGLDYGNLEGEYEALNILKQYDFDTLVLVVLSPLRNTLMEDVEYPEANSVKDIIKKAKEIFCDKPLSLGCVKGSGKYQAELEKYAVEFGFNNIAYPLDETILYAREKDYEIKFSEYCCSF